MLEELNAFMLNVGVNNDLLNDLLIKLTKE